MENLDIKITILQYDIAWEDKNSNLKYIESKIANIKEETDIVVLPEMCTTGFSYNVEELAETIEGETIERLKKISKRYEVALCGSLICKENQQVFNRAFFITPSDEFYYDKRHLFRIGREGDFFSPGNSKLIVNYKGYNICPLVCYDLRFPVWSRNVENAYDILIYVGNWPKARLNVWKTLLKARAIENMCCVVASNRVGIDKNNVTYGGMSLIVDHRGNVTKSLSETEEGLIIGTINKENMIKDRDHFPVWKDADDFKIVM